MGMTFQALTGRLGINTDRWTKGFDRAKKAASKFSARMGTTFKRIGKAALKATKLIVAAGTAIAAAMTVAGVSAVKTAATFEKQMDAVAAKSRAAGEEMVALTEKARELGRTTQFTATQSAEAMEVMAIAGLKTDEIMGAIEPTLQLAAAANVDIATAADIAAKTMRSMGLESKDMSHIMDVLTRTFTTSNTTIETLRESLKLVAPIAVGAGRSLEEVGALVGILGDNNIQGSMAGTTLRSAMIALIKPSKEASKQLAKYNIEVSDKKTGNLHSMASVIGQLNSRLKDMRPDERLDILARIFPTRSLAGILALMKSGSVEIERRTKDLEDSQGITATIAKEQMDNFAGSWKILQSAMESVKIEIGNKLIPILRPLVDMYAAWLQTNEKMIAQRWGDRLNAVVRAVKWLWRTVKDLIPVIQSGQAVGRAWIKVWLNTAKVIIFSVVAAIKKLNAGAIVLWRVFQDFWKTTGPAFVALMKEIAVVVIEILLVAWKDMGKTFDEFVKLIEAWGGDSWLTLWGKIKNTVVDLLEVFKIAVTWTGRFARVLIVVLGGAIKSQIKALKGLGKALWQLIKGDWKAAWQTAKDAVAESAENIMDTWQDMKDEWEDIDRERAENLSDTLGDMLDGEEQFQKDKEKLEKYYADRKKRRDEAEGDEAEAKAAEEESKRTALGRAGNVGSFRNSLFDSAVAGSRNFGRTVNAAGARAMSGIGRFNAAFSQLSPMARLEVAIANLRAQISSTTINLTGQRRRFGRMLGSGVIGGNVIKIREQMLEQLKKLVKIQEDELRRRRRLRLRQFRRFQSSRAEAARRRREAREVFGSPGGTINTGPTGTSGVSRNLAGRLSVNGPATVLQDNGTVNVQMTFTERITPESARRIAGALDDHLRRSGVDSFGRSRLRSRTAGDRR